MWHKYPYTSANELNLDWFLSQFKELTDAWDDQKTDYEQFKTDVTAEFNNLKGQFETLDETVAAFIEFVNNYFDNLDVQQEVNNKLDEMVSDGTLDSLIQPLFDTYTTTVNGIMSNQNSRITTLEGRMDTFASLPDGSTAGDAELLDIRVGYDGATYPSAGDAVREQVSHITPEMTTFVVPGGIDPDGNLIYPSDVTNNVWVNYSNGLRSVTTYTYSATDYVEIEPGASYTVLLVTGGGTSLFSYAFYDADKQPIAGAYGRTIGMDHFTAPANAKYLCYCYQAYDVAKPVMIKGTVPLDTYVAPIVLPLAIPTSDYVTHAELQPSSNVKFQLPEQYDLVVGDIFQIFWKGVLNAIDPKQYYIDTVCDIGKNFERMFSHRATADEIGTHNLNLKLYNSNNDLVDETNVTLNVVAKPATPAANKVVLYVTDSLGAGGYVPDEFNRRLTGTGGTPAGDQIGNVQFIGTNISVTNGTKYVGNGGWTWASYDSSMSTNAYMWITCPGHDKTAADQHSIYEDSNGVQWKLETIESGRIKLIRVSSAGTLPAIGWLTWVSGGENHSNIVYSSSEQAAGNPFWDENTNNISFSNFAAQQGVSGIDYVYVLLGWNSTGTNETIFKNNIRTFLTNVLADYPLCKIVILGLEVPARNGLATNYGENSGVLSSYMQSMEYVFKLNKIYTEISQEPAFASNVSFVNIAGQFDTEYNMPAANMQVNTRNATTIPSQTNGVHPAQSGYYQIADACYRSFAALL